MKFRRRSRDFSGNASTADTANEHLHVSLAQMRTALNSLPMGVVIVDSNGQEWWRNRTAHDMLDASIGSEILMTSVGELSRRAVRGVRDRVEIEIEGSPGKLLEARSIPSINGGGLVVLEDITERHLTDRVRTDFVANISHELKTPVGAMSLLAETILGELQDRPANEQPISLAHRIVDESQRVARIIDDLLELASIEFGGAAPDTPVSLNSVVGEAVARIQPFALNKEIRLMKNVVSDGVEVGGSSTMLVSAVSNLLENAVKYSERGSEVVVTVAVVGNSASLTVADSGIGIDVEHLDRIFERFYRVDPGRSRETGGTGLGLSIVRHIVTNHGGDITVSSHFGEGTSFEIRLPLYRG